GLNAFNGFNWAWPARTAEWRRARLAHQNAGDANVLGGKRQHGQLAGTFEGNVERPLMGGAGAGLTAWLDLAALGQKAAQPPEVLVIDHFDLVDAERADLTPGREFAAAAAELAWATTRTGPGATGGRGRW